MNERKLKQLLVATTPPDEMGAQRRGWRVVRKAFGEREPSPWPMRHRRPLTAVAVAVAVLAAAVSPPGRAVIDGVRDAVGTETVVGVPRPRPALFSLPAQGRVLVAAPGGVFVVSSDGSRRRLGAYEQATWSPQGLFVGVTKRHQLAAVTPRGQVRWTLSRPNVWLPRWSPSGFRIAYLSGRNLRIVAGDGTGDHRVDSAQRVAPMWKPGEEHVLAYSDRNGTINVIETDGAQTLWTAAGSASSPSQLEWSSDAARLLAVRRLEGRRFALVVFDGDGRRRQYLELPGTPIDAAFSPNSHRIALIRRVGARSELLVVDGDSLRNQSVVFSGRGLFSDVAWSPGGRWLLLGWQSADQWLFIRSADVSKVAAVSSLSAQFDPGKTSRGGFPRIEGWCCPG